MSFPNGLQWIDVFSSKYRKIRRILSFENHEKITAPDAKRKSLSALSLERVHKKSDP